MVDLDQLIALCKATPVMSSGASSNGMSHFAKSRACGMKAHIDRAFPYVPSGLEGTGKTAKGLPKLTGFRIGLFFGALQYLWWAGKVRPIELRSEPTSKKDDGFQVHADNDFTQAIKTFYAYAKEQDFTHDFYFTTLEMEYPIPENVDEMANLMAAFDGQVPTLRADRLVYINDAQLSRIALRFGCILAGPGRYFVDHKCLSSVNSDAAFEYSSSTQAIGYPVLSHASNPTDGDPVKGQIMDLFQRNGSEHIMSFIPPPQNALRIIQDHVRAGTKMFNEGLANPAACTEGFSACAHLKSGLCPRAGAFSDYAERWENARETPPAVEPEESTEK